MTDEKQKGKQGFASMDKDRQRAIASAGGKASHASGKGHQYTPAEARSAGRKGGAVVAKMAGHMSEIGRKGGLARVKKAREARANREANEAAFDADTQRLEDEV